MSTSRQGRLLDQANVFELLGRGISRASSAPARRQPPSTPAPAAQTDTMVLWTFSHAMAHPRVMECRGERTKIG
jgi:hypothetical protein